MVGGRRRAYRSPHGVGHPHTPTQLQTLAKKKSTSGAEQGVHESETHGTLTAVQGGGTRTGKHMHGGSRLARTLHGRTRITQQSTVPA